ncbi:hypothetical protein ACFV1N_46185 [Streptosporangium canum]|uniref:hypothetical protein n=1 Tax=Streptosporangium canum TaxID=324952 RepID=UPI0036B99619
MEQAQETYLRKLVRDRGVLPYSAFLNAYEVAARRAGLPTASITRKQYGRWLAGKMINRPQPDACRALEEMFGMPVLDLFKKVPVPRRPDPVVKVPPVSGVVWTTSETPPGTGYRSTSTSFQELMMSAAEESRASAANAEQALGQTTMEQLEADTYDVARAYLTRSPAVMFPQIVRLRAQVEEKTQQTRQPAQLRDLAFLNALLCLLLAEASIDLGEHTHAADHARTAWTHASNIGHVDLMTWARGMQATSAYWGDSPQRALIAVRRGEDHHPTGVAAARLLSIKARTWSHLGDAQQTVLAVRAAQEARASAGGIDDLSVVGGVFLWDRAREKRCASTALVELIQRRRDDMEPATLARLTEEILRHCEEALVVARAVPSDQHSVIVDATILLDMGTARLLGGDVAAAQETLRPVFDLPPDMRTYPVLHRLKSIRGELATTQQTRAVHELTEAVLGFAATSTVRELPPAT